jgi:hypothetical protein
MRSFPVRGLSRAGLIAGSAGKALQPRVLLAGVSIAALVRLRGAIPDPLADAVAVLRTARAGKPVRLAQDLAAAGKPREGTKEGQVLALLRRPEGAAIAQIGTATGWQAYPSWASLPA